MSARDVDTWFERFVRKLESLQKTKGHTHHGAALLSPNPEINREETRELSHDQNTNTTGADDEGTCYD